MVLTTHEIGTALADRLMLKDTVNFPIFLFIQSDHSETLMWHLVEL